MNLDANSSITSSAPIRDIGYVGMGIMGSAMAGNLLKAGFAVTVWNRTPTSPRVRAVGALGAKTANSAADLARLKPEVICINVTDTSDVEAVLFGPGGIVEGASRGLIVVDHSTISPVATQDFAARLSQHGIAFLDAPVSGGDVGARNATLSIMVGGPADVFEKCHPMFAAMGKTITHVGDHGAGQACKACNQIAVVCNLLGTCEAMAMAKAFGLDVKQMISVVGAGAGSSWQLTNLGPKIASGDYQPGFMIDLVLKDLAIIADASREKRLPLTGTTVAENHFRAAASLGAGKLGTQAMAKSIEQSCSLKLSD